VRCAPVAVPGGLGPHKWADRRLVDRLGAAGPVPLLVDRDGRLLEAAWGNVWVLERGRLVTPPADGRILPGVTRARLLELAPALGLDAAEEPIALAAAVDAPAILLTSSLQLVVQAALGRAATPGAPSATIEAIWTALRSSAWSPGRTSAACGHRPVVTRALRP
jgi:para-aminobenzoate synthetase/4-amino-4-deoxychorismate lyase